jgi:hypothetical protein
VKCAYTPGPYFLADAAGSVGFAVAGAAGFDVGAAGFAVGAAGFVVGAAGFVVGFCVWVPGFAGVVCAAAGAMARADAKIELRMNLIIAISNGKRSTVNGKR